MTNRAAIAILAGSLHCVCNAALAGETFGATLGFTTEYVRRGMSQSRGDPALQAGAYWAPVPQWHLGAWLATMETRDGDDAQEVDVYLARSWSLHPDWLTRVMLTHYDYPGSGAARPDAYDELSMALTFRQSVTVSVAWSPNTSYYSYGWPTTRSGDALAYELSAQRPLARDWALFAGVGYYDLQALFDRGYWYWNAGLAYSWQRLQLDLTHVSAEATAHDLFPQREPAHRWAASLTWRF